MEAPALKTQVDANSLGFPVSQPHHPPNFMPDNLTATTLRISPSLGQAQQNAALHTRMAWFTHGLVFNTI